MDERDNQDTLDAQSAAAEQPTITEPADTGLDFGSDLEESFVLGYN